MLHSALSNASAQHPKKSCVFAAQWLASACPCRRFAGIRANADARLGVDVERYSFIRVDLHRLLFASFTGAPTIKLRVLILIFAL